MTRFLSLVWKNALRNRRRSILTVFSMALSLCLLGLMLSIYYALYLSDTPPSQALRITTRNRVAITSPVPVFYMDRIAKVPGVRKLMYWQWYGGTYKDARDPNNFFARFGIDPVKMFDIFTEIQLPEDQKKAFQSDRRGAIVGRVLAERFGWQLGERLTFTGDIFPGTLELVIRGIYESELGSETLYFNWEYVREGLSMTRKDMISSISILADSPEAVPRIINTVDDMFRNSTVQTRTETERAFALGFVNSLGNVKLILLSVCGAVTFTIMLVAANTMAMSIRERTREIGILKTLGFKPGLILFIILGEAVLLACLGGSVGHLFASGLCGLIRNYGPAFSNQIRTLTVPWPVIGVMFTTSIFIALASSLLPAYSASRINILEALRRTD
ncbi:MAG: ABC transporter permease [Acidobacteria bacterium]|nr:ABC transporter permease [Acidobacteriota bacterium]